MNPTIPKNPLSKIALSCSGGGYRAASFHLGAMAYLNKLKFQGKPLLENVKLISTVSGGTITGAVYALMKQDGKSFEEIYKFLLTNLRHLDLVKSGIEKLDPAKALNNPYKRKNLINAFAELYDQHFTSGATFEKFNNMRSHLDAVVFNSTEFNNGINFRFRNKDTGFFGNHEIRIEPAAAQEVKVADAVAASACFPGGFEPMIWPHDFIHEQSPNLKDLIKKNGKGIGIMDGGIYDNQGIQSILLYERKFDEPYFDLIIISDVASPDMKSFQAFAEKPKEGIRALSLSSLKEKVSKINKTLTFSLIAVSLLLFAAPLFWQYTNTFLTGLMLGLALAPLLVLIFKWIVMAKVKEAFNSVTQRTQNMIPVYYRSRLAGLKIETLSVHRIEPLVFDRLNSLVTLLMDVFLKVVRRLNYSDLYNDKKFTYRRVSNLIKELTEDNFTETQARTKNEGVDKADVKSKSILKGTYDEVVGSKIKAVAQEASSFGTTLWFTEDHQLQNMLDKLVATGQFTMCYNLLDYLEQILFVKNNGFEALEKQTQKELHELYETIVQDWKAFKEDPMMNLY
ncbi:MAG: patatin-like phospholipase family protein [Cytophagia bacterium]|nr:patatin-like phospholipase family protein [Cytophagia bacterium]